jgi:DNA polymerase III sliding clamp (beta) subunit (PCNA family)
MKATTDRDLMIRALARCMPATGKDGTSAAAGKILLRADDSGPDPTLSLYGSSPALQAETAIVASAVTAGTAGVDAKRLQQAVASMPKGNLLLATGEGNRLSIRSGTRRFWLPLVDELVFPNPGAPVVGSPEIVIPAASLLEAVARVKGGLADSIEAHTDGVWLESEEGDLWLVTYSGFSLFWLRIALPTPAPSWACLLPSGALRMIETVCAGHDNVTLTHSSPDVFLAVDDTVVGARLPVAPFPQWKAISAMRDAKILAKFDPIPALASVEAVRVALHAKIPPVRLTIGEGRMHISSARIAGSPADPSDGYASDAIPVDQICEGVVEFGTSARDIASALEGSRGEVTLYAELREKVAGAYVESEGGRFHALLSAVDLAPPEPR